MPKKELKSTRIIGLLCLILSILIIIAPIIWIMVISSVLTACIEEREVKPTFLNLEYMYSIENIDLSRHNFFNDGEFTWFQVYDTSTFEAVKGFIKRDYGIELPYDIELDSNSFITISVGRRLLMLYYFEEHRYNTHSGEVFARPVFEREYSPKTLFIYRVTPLPRYRFVFQKMFTDDLIQFNTFNNIPFEFWEFDRTMQSGANFGTTFPFQRLFPRSNPFREFSEPLYGYINIQEIELRSMPTRKSRVLSRNFQGDELTILGYVQNGEIINGIRRWYRVRTAMGSGNQLGYIHSSFITFNNDNLYSN